MDKYELKVKKPSDPDLINWENFGATKIKTIVQGVTHISIYFFLLVLGMLLVMGIGKAKEVLLSQYPIFTPHRTNLQFLG